METTGLTKRIQSEIEKNEELKKVKEKKFRYPFGKKVGKKQRRNNFVTTLVINENGTCDFRKYQINEQTVLHDLIPRLATSGHMLFDKKGNPLIILPNWSVEPFSPLEHYKETMIDGSNTKGYKILMSRMLSDKVDAKKQMGSLIKWILGLGLGAIIIYAFMTSGG